MMRQTAHGYVDGPTACAAHPSVVRNIHKQLKENRILSLADARMAQAMGLIAADAIERTGFNDGTIYPPEESVSRAAALAASPSRAASRSAPRGTLHALALLVDFSDNQGTRPASEFQKLLFDANNPKSMASFYHELSFGGLTVTGEVHGYIRAQRPYSYYTDGQSGTGLNFPRNTPGLLRDALDIFCQNDSLQRFDQDGDGYVDAVFLIHAGAGAEAERDATKRPHMIWSHKWVLPTPFVHQGVRVYAYSTEPEDGRLGVFAHEFGHVLGLPDLYDTTYRSGGVGTWCLMGSGSWAGQGHRPTRLCCWALSQLEWTRPQVVQTNGKLVLPPLADDPAACYRLWTAGQLGPEYFLLENRRNSGLDRELPGSGLALWHIDERQSDNTNALAYRVALVQADGRRDLEFNRNSGDDGDLFPGTMAVTRIDDTTVPALRANDGTATGLSLSQIALDNQGVVTVNAKIGPGRLPATKTRKAGPPKKAAATGGNGRQRTNGRKTTSAKHAVLRRTAKRKAAQ